jgi:hypothetical protein
MQREATGAAFPHRLARRRVAWNRSGMAARKKKPWNADLKMPGLGSQPESPMPKPMSDKVSPGHSTPGAPVEQWECLRCEQLRAGLDPLVPDHTPRCAYRGTGRDPEPKG